jgi:TonB-dependent receptor
LEERKLKQEKTRVILVKRSVYAVSVALASLISANAAMAQEGAPAAPAAAPGTEIQQVLVIGARASQQSSIERKRNAPTAMDSIISEDVGSFPDRNVGDAISRVAGIAINRGDFGEGTSLSVRGNGAELTRVEMDGQAVQSGGGTDLLGGGDGRGVEFRELSSDLIKSVDVVKGSTADMVEGSLGGGIIIKTRNGLDFKKPFYSLRLGATQGLQNKKTTPNLNLVVADKFLDGRLGVLVNLNQSRYLNESHSLANGGNNNQQGPQRNIDLDSSPEKTFTLNPAALSKTDPSVNSSLFAAPLTAGGFFNAATPMELLTKAGAAKTKDECRSLFPALSTQQLGAINNASNRAFAVNARANELTSCLNQWNDYTPSIIRQYVRSQDDTRTGGDVRLDFKVNNQLSVYGKLSRNRRSVDDVVGNIQLGNVSINNAAVNSGSTGYVGSSFTDNVATNTRTAVPNSGYYTFPDNVSFRASGQMPVNGATANIKPGYTVDDTHHLTSYTITDGSYITDMIFSKVETTSDYFQAGGIYKDGDLKIEFLAGDARSTSIRHDRRTALSYGYGEANFKLLPDGAWGFGLPAGSTASQLNYDAYARLIPQVATAAVAASEFTPAIPAYTAAQKPLLTPGMNMQVIRVRQSASEEATAKADLSYNLRDRLPYFTGIKAGFNLRKTDNEFWSPAGSTTIKDPVGTFGTAGFQPGIYLPGFNSSSRVVGCKDTPTSLAAGGQPCVYGYAANPSPTANYSGTTTLTQDQYRELVKDVLSIKPSGQFYGGAANRAPELLSGWNQIDIDKLYAATGTKVNLDCVVRCTASDGKVYDQPVSRFNEKSYAGYFMTDFDIDHLPFSKSPLPFGIELSGNIGVRVVKTNVMGTGTQTFTTIKTTPQYDPLNRDAAGGITTAVYRRNVSIQDDSTDVMPIYNLALWAVPNKLVVRYNHAKTVARPGMSRLLPSNSCTYDDRIVRDSPDDLDGSDPDQKCGGVMGNPGVKPFTNTNKNLSVEWYVNKDTMFSAAAFRQIGLIGAPNKIVPRTGVKVFEGSDAVDPVSGQRLADMEFAFNQYDNLEPSTRRGVEFATKTAFTFLPSVLRHTGLDANYTRVKSDAAQPSVDLLTGDVLPPVGEPKYSYNASLWYDDGRFSARVALQVVAPRYQCFAPCTTSNIGVNNFPAEGAISIRAPYNPGLPIFSDATRFIDVKVAYKFKNNIEVFAEARNVTNQRTQTSTGGYENYTGGVPFLYQDNFNGRRIMVGLNIRSAQ